MMSSCAGLLFVLIATVVTLTIGMTSAAADDIFRPYLDGKPPKIVSEITAERAVESAGEPTVRLREVVYEARAATADREASNIFAVIARPVGDGPFPGLLVFHGGKGSAEKDKAIAWARRGYVAVAIDIPGVADPDAVKHSTGPILARPYGTNRFRVQPDPTASSLFEGMVAAVKAFDLLCDQPSVDTKRVGVVGISWGGYTTTMVASLLGDRVKAAFSVYGCGFYENCVFKKNLDKLSAEEQKTWIDNLDAGRRAAGIKCAFFIAAPTNDIYFYPEAVRQTLEQIPGPHSHLFAPNDNHTAKVPGGTSGKGHAGWLAMEEDYFAYHLKNEGKPLPTIAWVDADASDPRTVHIRVDSEVPVDVVTVFYSRANRASIYRIWKVASARPLGEGRYEATIPPSDVDVECFASVSDERPVTVSTNIRRVPPDAK